MRRANLILAAMTVLAGGANALGGDIKLATDPTGDAEYAWNSRYGPWGYATGGASIGVGLQMGGQYGNDYTIGIIEIPIGPLAGHDLSAAMLHLNSLGFGTGYYYGSANLGWQNNDGATGDVVADGRGPLGLGSTVAQIWNSDWGHDSSGLRSFDVLTQVQADLAAGRAFSTFVISGSRDTGGGVRTAESGFGPFIIASGTTIVPEPAGLASVAIAGAAACLGRRRRTA